MLFSLCFALLIVMCLVLEWKVTRERNAMNGDSSFTDSDSFFDEGFLNSAEIHESKRLITIFENIENYDGTSARQKEVI